MDNNTFVLQKIYSAMQDYMQSQNSTAQVGFLAGYPYKTSIGKTKTSLNEMLPFVAVNLMTSFIVRVAEQKGPVGATIKDVKNIFTQVQVFVDQRNVVLKMFYSKQCIAYLQDMYH